MSVYLRKGTYYADVDEEGFPRVRKSLKTSDRKEALRLERDIRRQVLSGEYFKESPNVSTSRKNTLGDAFDTALSTVWKGQKSTHSVVTNIKVIHEFFPKDTRLDTITTPRIAQFTAWLQKRYDSGATINRKLSTLQRLLTVACELWEVIPKVPRFVRQQESEGRIRTLSYAEEVRHYEAIAAMEDVLDNPVLFRDLCVFLVETGCRLSEALRLTPKDVVGDNVLFWETKHKYRAVPMTALVKEIMERYKTTIRPFSALGTIFQIEYRWRKVRTYLREDASYTPHILRHTFATRMIEAGVDIYTISKWLGHANVKTTERYAKVRPMHLRSSKDKLEALRESQTVSKVCVADDVNREQRA